MGTSCSQCSYPNKPWIWGPRPDSAIPWSSSWCGTTRVPHTLMRRWRL
uniref:(California timema) hypothetical protein n=1 Tax=Timema californicum TaxID=61474 RepID=A0A7R9PFC5_TIMCA|nr:unnamed protein product [Timema californicum]